MTTLAKDVVSQESNVVCFLYNYGNRQKVMKVKREVLVEVLNIIKHNKCYSRFSNKLKTKKYKSY